AGGMAVGGQGRGSGQIWEAEELEAALGSPRVLEVRQALEECARGDPRDPPAMLLLGRGYLLQGDESRAVLWFERAARLEAGSSEYQLWLGRGYGAQAVRASPPHQLSLPKKVRLAFPRAAA